MGFSCSSLKVKQIFCFVFHFKMVTGEVKRDQVYGINEESCNAGFVYISPTTMHVETSGAPNSVCFFDFPFDLLYNIEIKLTCIM